MFECEFLALHGGLQGTDDACRELLPYRDLSARQSAILLTLSILSVFLLPSFCLSLLLSLSWSHSSPHFLRYHNISTKSESKPCWLDGYIFISDRLQPVDALCLERASELTIPLCSHLGSVWRVWHIQYCVYGYWWQPGQWMFLSVLNPLTDSVSAKTLEKQPIYSTGRSFYLWLQNVIFHL